MTPTKFKKRSGAIGDRHLNCPTRDMPSLNTAISSSPRLAAKVSLVLLVVVAVVGLLAVYFVAGPGMADKTPAPGAVAEAVKIPDLEATKLKAEQGDADAQKVLGTMYAKGQGVQEDYKEAAKWYLKSAEQGHAGAQVAMAELYEAGQGVTQDNAEAANWFRKAAEQGYAPGQYGLAVCYVLGQGVPPSDVEALKWYRQAADQGDDLSQFNLGMRYLRGTGVAASPVDAYQWLSLAAAQGVADAGRQIEELKRKMTPEQIIEGRRRADSFVPKKAGKTAQ